MFVHRKQPIAEINLVPYIDVMLVLVVIFMITTPLLTQGVEVNLPREASKVIEEQQQEPIIITVKENGDLFLNTSSKPNQAIPTQRLLTEVAAELIVTKDQPRMVLVRGDKNVAYGNIARVMALLQQIGVEKVGLLTQNPEEA